MALTMQEIAIIDDDVHRFILTKCREFEILREVLLQRNIHPPSLNRVRTELDRWKKQSEQGKIPVHVKNRIRSLELHELINCNAFKAEVAQCLLLANLCPPPDIYQMQEQLTLKYFN